MWEGNLIPANVTVGEKTRKKKRTGFNWSPIESSIIFTHSARPDGKWGTTDHFTQRFRREGGKKWEVRGSERKRPTAARRLSDLSPSPFCRAIKGKITFSYCFIKHYVALFIAVSPDGCSIPAAPVCTAPDQTEKTHLSSFTWYTGLSASVPPPQRYTTSASVCVRQMIKCDSLAFTMLYVFPWLCFCVTLPQECV